MSFYIDILFNKFLLNKKIDIEKEYKEYLQQKYNINNGFYKKELYELKKENSMIESELNNVEIVCKYEEYERELSKYFKKEETFLIDKKLKASNYIYW